MSSAPKKKQDNKFEWTTYNVPRHLPTDDDDDDNNVEWEEGGNEKEEELEKSQPQQQSFVIRHLKQGRTGAVKTWPTAEALLDYLVLRGGLDHNHNDNNNNDTLDDLDLTIPPPSSSSSSSPFLDRHCYNIVELGGGTGYLSVGLAMAFNELEKNKNSTFSRISKNNKNVDDTPTTVTNSSSCTSTPTTTTTTTTEDHHQEHRRRRRKQKPPPFRPRMRLLCTDNDKGTIKNMRYNISEQPREQNVHKAVRVEMLEWGNNTTSNDSNDNNNGVETTLGGAKFAKAVGAQFHPYHKEKEEEDKKEEGTPQEEEKDEPSAAAAGEEKVEEKVDEEQQDPMRLLTHVIASDVLFGEATGDPLSTVISNFKLRNPNIVVILLLKERTPNVVAKLQAQIEEKVRCGQHQQQRQQQQQYESTLSSFSVSVRDVRHQHLTKLKMVEC
jgi:hypothetical protein